MDFIIMLLLIKKYKFRCTKPFFFHMGTILLRINFVRGIVYSYIGRPHDLHTAMAYDLKTWGHYNKKVYKLKTSWQLTTTTPCTLFTKTLPEAVNLVSWVKPAGFKETMSKDFPKEIMIKRRKTVTSCRTAKQQKQAVTPKKQKTATDASSEYSSHSKPCCRPWQHDCPSMAGWLTTPRQMIQFQNVDVNNWIGIWSVAEMLNNREN